MSADAENDYGWSSSDASCSHDYISPTVLSIAARFNSKKILDLGCGNGVLCNQLKNEGHEVVGVEYDKKGCQISAEANKDLNFYNLGVQDDPSEIVEKEGFFDMVVSTEVIEHLFSPHHLPQFSSKLLVDNGYLVVTTPYHGYLKNLVLSLLNKWDSHHTALWHGGHIKFWSKDTLTQLLEDNGFKVIGFTGVGRAPYLWKSMVLIAQKA